jgi:transcription elongation factor Elf1
MRWRVSRWFQFVIWDSYFSCKTIDGTVSAMINIYSKVSDAAEMLKGKDEGSEDDESNREDKNNRQGKEGSLELLSASS